MASSAFVDSKAVFQGRAKAMGLPDHILLAMERKGWSTIATFAFSSGYVPGTKEDAPFVDQVLVPLCGAADAMEAPVIRRLFFECFTLLSAELKSRIERGADDGTRKLAEPERRVRFKQLEAVVQGITITDAWEPAHALVDLFVEMMERNALAYVPWEKSISRVMELAGGKKDVSWQPGQDHTVREVQTTSFGSADFTSDFKLFQLLARRGMAAHMANILRYPTHDKWTQILLSEMHREAPAGYTTVSIAQLQRADLELWTRVAEATRDGIQVDHMGRMPAEEAFKTFMDSYQGRLLLMPLPRHGNSVQAQAPHVARPHAGQNLANQQGAKTAMKSQPRQPEQKISKSQKKVKRQEHRTGKYGASKTPEGAEICYAFNGDKGCSKGASCSRKHVCQRCFGDHQTRRCQAKA